MIKLTGIGHVLLRVAGQEASKRFYRDVLGFRIAEEEPEHGGVFITSGESFHTLDIGQHPNPKMLHAHSGTKSGSPALPFRVGSHTTLREAHVHLLENCPAQRQGDTQPVPSTKVSPHRIFSR